MAVDNYILQQISERVGELDADLAEINAGLARARSNGDDYKVKELIQGYANAKAERRNLEVESEAYIRDNTPQPVNRDAWRSKQLDQMTPNDAFEMINATSKYGKVTPEEYRQGYAEVQRRKAAGDLQNR